MFAVSMFMRHSPSERLITVSTEMRILIKPVGRIKRIPLRNQITGLRLNIDGRPSTRPYNTLH